MSPTLSYLTREDAADRLNVSVRTIDRYIRRNFFQTDKIDQHVWISRASFERYYREHRTHAGIKNPRNFGHLEANVQSSAMKGFEDAEDAFESAPELRTATSRSTDYDLHPTQIYKSLYEELKEKSEEQQKRLEGAHYRVGQLEAQLKDTVPLLDFKREEQRFLLVEKQQKMALEEVQGRFARLKGIYKSERLNKNVYIALVYGLLALHVVFWART